MQINSHIHLLIYNFKSIIQSQNEKMIIKKSTKSFNFAVYFVIFVSKIILQAK